MSYLWANIIVATLFEKTRGPITATLWARRGLQVMIVPCVIVSLIFCLAFAWFGD